MCLPFQSVTQNVPELVAFFVFIMRIRIIPRVLNVGRWLRDRLHEVTFLCQRWDVAEALVNLLCDGNDVFDVVGGWMEDEAFVVMWL